MFSFHLLNNICHMNFPRPSKEIFPEFIVAVIGFIVLVCCFSYLKYCSKEFEELTGIIRVVVALSTAAVSIALPGFINLDTQKENAKTDTVWPKIRAGGALAIFIIVYLFDPIEF